MKIIFNANFWNQPNTGSGQYLRALFNALQELDTSNEYELIEPAAVGGQPSFAENLAKVWFEQIAFPRACQRERADLAHVPYFGSALFPGTRTVVTIHDLIPMLLPLYRGSLLVRAYTQLAALSARRADAIIADSTCSQRDIVRLLRVPESRVRVVYLAADARFRPVADTRAVADKYTLPDQFVLYLGGFDQRKNVRVIIEAFAQLDEFYRAGWRLVLSGVKLGEDSMFFPDPRRIAREANLPDDAIQYLGWVNEADKPALYSRAGAFVFPSLYEGFGLPPLEAMACGTPVLASNASSLPEIIGDAGILLEPNDARAWADALRAVLADETRRATMRERGIAHARKFSWRRAAEETLAVYTTVVGAFN
ncbi:MAG: glycosyltransferase family 4 protein [Chloroflexi bacterium]|nr:glycosyltransferase family 4 protein [Chloroflexota bacterium]